MNADLYFDRIDPLKYLPQNECALCFQGNCKAFMEDLKRGCASIEECKGLNPSRRYALDIAVRAEEILPKVQVMEVPRPGFTGLYELNGPDERSPVIITGNAESTQEVIFTIFSLTLSSFFLLFVDTMGDTVDMAMVNGTLNRDVIIEALCSSFGEERTGSLSVILPGFAASIARDLGGFNLRKVQQGPICAAELPLFLGDLWGPPP